MAGERSISTLKSGFCITSTVATFLHVSLYVFVSAAVTSAQLSHRNRKHNTCKFLAVETTRHARYVESDQDFLELSNDRVGPTVCPTRSTPTLHLC